MKKIIFAILLLVTSRIHAQKDEIPETIRNYEKDIRTEMIDLTQWGKHPGIYSLQDSELKEPAVVITDNRGDFLEVIQYNNSNVVFNYRMYYKRIHLNDDRGVESFNKIYLGVNNKIDLVDLRAHAIAPNGKITKEFDENDMKITEEEGKKYLILAIDGAEKGGEIEYFYIIRRNMSEYGSINIQGSTYIRNFGYTMRVPQKVEYILKGYNGCPEVENSKKGEYNIYEVKTSKVPVLAKEEYQSYDASLMRIEYVFAYLESKGRQRFNTFADFSKNVVNNISKQEKESQSDIKKLSKKLKLNELSNDEEKIRTIENWIKTNIIYFEAIDFKSIKELIKNKLGDTRGLMRLYIYLFNYNKIKYQIWCTTNKSDKEFDEALESFNFLDDYYFYFPESKKFIDFKNLAWRLGLPPSAIIGQKAVQIKIKDLGDGITTSTYTVGMADVPACTESNEILEMDVTLNSSLTKGTVKYHGKEAGYENYFKTIYLLVTDEAKRKEEVESYIKRFCQDATGINYSLKNENIEDIKQAALPSEIEATFTGTKFIENAGNKVIIKVGDFIGKQTELYSEKVRQTDIVNPYPHMYTRVLTFHLPEGYEVKGLEKFNINRVYKLNKGEQEDSLGFISTYKIEGNTITISCTEYYQVTTWPKNRYEEFRTLINMAADFNKLTLILDPKK